MTYTREEIIDRIKNFEMGWMKPKYETAGFWHDVLELLEKAEALNKATASYAYECGKKDAQEQMTRAEAIEIIKREFAMDEDVEQLYPEVVEAREMAISALEQDKPKQPDICPIYDGVCGYPIEFCSECPRHTKQEPCKDAISRAEIVKECIRYANHENNVQFKKEVSEHRKHDAKVIIYVCDYFKRYAEQLPYVQPSIDLDKHDEQLIKETVANIWGKEPSKGHWIKSHIPESVLAECSECGFSCGAFSYNFCPNCGADMNIKECKENND